METERPLLVIVGPTASGKTELSLVLAERLDAEIISADSVQIYRHFDIGSGKPTSDELARAPHHFIGTHDPLDELDAASWAKLAEERLAEITARGRRPIVCGGSYLWVRALLYGLAEAPAADPALRAQHQAVVDQFGRAALHQRLAEVDAETAERLAPNDFVRVSRALEVYQLTGRKMSQWQAEHGFRRAKRRYRLIGIKRESTELDQRIRARALHMLDRGFVAEVLDLCRRGYAKARAMGSVGYREVYAALRGSREVLDLCEPVAGLSDATRLEPSLSSESVDENLLLDAIARKTRIFARRQRTWLRDEPVLWLAPDAILDPEELVSLVLAEAERAPR